MKRLRDKSQMPFAIELHYRRQLQFVREFSSFCYLIHFHNSLEHITLTNPEKKFEVECSGEIRYLHCLPDEEPFILYKHPYPHKGEIKTDHGNLTGFQAMKLILMTL